LHAGNSGDLVAIFDEGIAIPLVSIVPHAALRRPRQIFRGTHPCPRPHGEDEPRLGAKLADTERERSEQTLRKRGGAFTHAPGRTKTGFRLLISAKTGMGCGREAAASKSARLRHASQ